MPDTPVAIVTGASRGIGRAGALALAEAGFDVVVSSRTVKEGEGVAEANSVREDRNLSVPGSLERTAQEVEERGRRALIVPLDLMDRESVVALPKRALEEWGRVDVLFNNAVFRGVGNLDRIEDLTPQSMMDVFTGNFIHQILLIQGVLPHMKERGSGVIANMVSGSARWDPPGPPGEGGWGIVYSGSKAAFGRVAGGMNAEHLASGIKTYNLDPGNVITEARKVVSPQDEYDGEFGNAPAEATGKVVAWLATDPGAEKFLGKWIYAPKLCSDLGLIPGWTMVASNRG
jgi:NAD(P)-dependent dehydrogenase (short-subunit alcohol dehydrogenase family)